MCAHPGIDKDPVRVEIIGDDGVIREGVFKDNQWKRVLLEADELSGSKVLTFQASRTWNPKLAGISEDTRDLGVAVAVLRTD
jgi:hypothetical protein